MNTKNHSELGKSSPDQNPKHGAPPGMPGNRDKNEGNQKGKSGGDKPHQSSGQNPFDKPAPHLGTR
ncbi:MAG: hypothetical protein ACYC97_06330 [Metallibacterium sp.]